MENPTVTSDLYFRRSTRALAALALAALALTDEIDPLYLGALGAAWLVGWFLDSRPTAQEPIRRAETPLAVLFLIWMVVDFSIKKSTVFLTVAHFLILFQCLKLLGKKVRRDHFQILLMSFFQILASCTLSVDVWEGLVLLLFIPMAAPALFWNHIGQQEARASAPVTEENLRAYRRVSWMISAGALPITLFLTFGVFTLFPRLNFNVSLPGMGNPIIGYSNDVNLDQSGEIQDQPSSVLWLGFLDDASRRRWTGYLRGGTLDRFNGREWTATESRAMAVYPDGLEHVFHFPRVSHAGSWIRCDVTLLNPEAATVFLPGQPVEVSAPFYRLLLGSDGTLHWTQSLNRPVRYLATTVSSESDAADPPDPQVDRSVPGPQWSRVATLARQIGGSADADTQAQRIENYFKNGFSYSTNLGPHGLSNPLEYFLFTSRRGPCTLFASAMAVMLRLNGIPARLVSGFWQGEWNEPAHQFLFRERDAHAWVEVYIPRLGWKRFDPSPRVAPVSHLAKHFSLLPYVEYLQLKWNRLIIQYDLYSQIHAFERLRDSSQNVNSSLIKWWNRWTRRSSGSSTDHSRTTLEATGLTSHVILTLVSLSALVALLLFWFNRGKMQRKTHRDVFAYHRFLQQMARAGLPKRASETGLEYEERLKHHPLSRPIDPHTVVKNYYRARFLKMLVLFVVMAISVDAARLFADDGTPDLASLIKALKSDDADQCERAAEAIQKMGPSAKAAIPALRKTLTSDYPYVRNKSADALASIGAAAVPALSDALSSDSSDVRTISAGALGAIGPEAASASAALARTLQDPDFTVRASATNALEKIGSPAIPAILPLFADPSPQTRMVAIRTASAIHTSDERVVKALIHSLADDDNQVRLTAMKAIARQGKGAVPLLASEGLGSDSASIRAQASDVLGDIGRASGAAVPALTSALKDSDPAVRASAATALGKIGSAAQSAVPALKTLTQDSDPNVAAKAQDALTNLTALFGGDNTPPSLVNSFASTAVPSASKSAAKPAHLHFSHPPARRHKSMIKAKTMPKKKIDPAIAQWIKQLGNADDVERLDASHSLIAAGTAAVSGLVGAVHHSTDSVRILSCEILGKMGPAAADAVPVLVETVDDPNPDIEVGAATALVMIDTTTAFKVLGDMAKSDPDPARRVLAITTLGDAGVRAVPAVPILSDVLKDTDTAISNKASFALTQIGTPEALADVKMYDRLQTSKGVQIAVRELRANTADIDPRAVDELFKIGAPGVIPMSQNLKDPNPRVRGGVARALNRLGRDATPATGSLIAALDDDDATVRHEAAQSLEKIDTQDAQKALRFFSIKDWYKTQMQRFKH